MEDSGIVDPIGLPQRADFEPRAAEGVLRAVERAPTDRILRLVPRLPIFVTVSSALVLVVRANWYFMRPHASLLFTVDEGYASALGARLLSGRHLPYVDGVSHRGPIFYWAIALTEKLFGTGTWMPMRALALASMLLTLAGGVAAALVARRAVAGAAFAIALPAIWAGSFVLMDGLGCNSEHVLNAFALPALALVTLALRRTSGRRRLWLLAFAGACVMLAALSKQVGGVLLFPFFLWIGASALRYGGFADPRRYVPLAAFAAGALTPLLLVVARYAVASELSTFWYYFYTYNANVYIGALSRWGRTIALRDAFLGRYDFVILGAPLAGLAVARLFAGHGGPAARFDAYAGRGFENTVLVGFAVSLLASNAAYRNFSHYYLQVVPWAALLGGLALDEGLRRWQSAGSASPVATFWSRSLVLAPMIAVAGFGWHYRALEYAVNKDVQSRFATETWPVCDFVRKHSGPNDAIFLWGFNPAPYTACNRRPASRYVFTTFVAGFVPWIGASRSVEESRAVPHSREILFDELEREKPPIILDDGESLVGHSMFDIPVLGAYLHQHYCAAVEPVKPPAYLRRTASGDCPAGAVR